MTNLATSSHEDRLIGSRGEYGHGNPKTSGRYSKPNTFDKADFNRRSRRAARLALQEAEDEEPQS